VFFINAGRSGEVMTCLPPLLLILTQKHMIILNIYCDIIIRCAVQSILNS